MRCATLYSRNRRELALVAALTALAATLRLYHLGAQSMWLDELFSVAVARRDWLDLISATARDTQPPLSYLMLHVMLQLGTSEVFVRLFPALFSIGAIPLLYLTAKQLFGSVRISAIATCLAVLSPFQIAYGQEGRMYAQLAFLQLAGIYLFSRAWTGGRSRTFVGFAFVEILAFYSHSLAALGILALDVFALWRWSELQNRWRGLLLAHLLMALSLFPWLVILQQQVIRVLVGFWNPTSTLVSLLRTTYVLNLGTALPSLLVPLGMLVALFLFGLALYKAGGALWKGEPRENQSGALQLALCITIVPPVALLVLSLIRPIYVERVLITSGLGMYLLWGWAWTNIMRIPERVAIALGAGLVLIGLANYYLNPNSQKPPMREAAELLASRYGGEPVLHTSDSTALAFDYYLPSIPQHYLAGDPDYVNPTTRGNSGLIAGLDPIPSAMAVGGAHRFWLVAALDHEEEYQQKRVDEFSAQYRLMDQAEMGGIYLLLYGRP